MSEMNNPENKNPQEQLLTYIEQSRSWLGDAAELVGAERETELTDIFPAAPETRDEGKAVAFVDGQEKELPKEQYEASLREIAGRFGIGGERDVETDAQIVLLEGGKPWKVEAEAKIADEAKVLIFAGSPYRRLGQDETEFLAAKLPEGVQPAETEYDMVRQIAELQEGFEALENDVTLAFGYDINNGFEVSQAETGQLIHFGTLQGRDVVLLRVDRENYQDEEGNSKYRNQPDSAALMGIVSDVLALAGDTESSVGMNTSNTYASRAIDAMRAGLRKNRSFKVGMYGRQTLADTGAPVPAQTAYHQIPGELHTIATKLQQLESELS